MKSLKYAAFAVIAVVTLSACADEKVDPVIATMNAACTEGNFEACQAVMNNRVGAPTR